MQITLEECLKLPALKDSKVLAGNRGLTKKVKLTSVLENAQSSVLSDDKFLGNELIISALVSIKDDVDDQCETIIRLHNAGASGLILYYVGIFLPKVDKRLIEISNQLNFPLICMPPNDYSYRYGDAISQIYEAILDKKYKKENFVYSMISKLSQMKEGRQNFEEALNLLSEKNKAEFVILDRMSEREYLSESLLNYKNIKEIHREIVGKCYEILDTCPELTSRDYIVKGIKFSIKYKHIRINENFWMYIFSISEGKLTDDEDLIQAEEFIKMFVSIWKNTAKEETINELISNIINDDPISVKQISNRLSLDISSIRSMWVIKNKEKNLSIDEIQNNKTKCIKHATSFFKNNNRLAVVGFYNDDVIILFETSSFRELDEGLARDFKKELENNKVEVRVFDIDNLSTTSDVRNEYLFLEKMHEDVIKIFPYKEILNLQDIQFAYSCKSIASRGDSEVNYHCRVIDKISDNEAKDKISSKDILVETLSTYFLDADENTEKAGELLYVHKNTIKYRIKKISSILGYDITLKPAAFNLYLAVSLSRMLNN